MTSVEQRATKPGILKDRAQKFSMKGIYSSPSELEQRPTGGWVSCEHPNEQMRYVDRPEDGR